jgi:hypothetical protein
MTVQVLDLGLVVPLLATSALLVLRGGQAGRWLAAVMGVSFVAMAAAISAMLLSAALVAGSAEVAPLALFGATTAIAAAVTFRMLSSAASRPRPVPRATGGPTDDRSAAARPRPVPAGPA